LRAYRSDTRLSGSSGRVTGRPLFTSRPSTDRDRPGAEGDPCSTRS
jgi:hypothetical protein